MLWLLFACTASSFDTANLGGQSGSESAMGCEAGSFVVITESDESSELDPLIDAAAGDWSGSLERSGGTSEALSATFTPNSLALQRFEPSEDECSPYYSVETVIALESDDALRESRSGALRLYDDGRTSLVLEIPVDEIQGDLTDPTGTATSLRITAERSANTWQGVLLWEGATMNEEGTFTLER